MKQAQSGADAAVWQDAVSWSSRIVVVRLTHLDSPLAAPTLPQRDSVQGAAQLASGSALPLPHPTFSEAVRNMSARAHRWGARPLRCGRAKAKLPHEDPEERLHRRFTVGRDLPDEQ